MAASVIITVLLGSLISCSSGKTLLGASSSSSSSSSSLCTLGPDHWCQSVTTAESCDAVKYCEQKVWMQKKEDFAAASDQGAFSGSVSSVPIIPVIDKAVEMIPITAIRGEARVLSQPQKPPSSPSSSSSPNDMCTYCEEAVNYAKILLGNPEAEKEIEGVLMGLCGQLGPLKEPCEEYVKENIAQIVHTLAHVDTKTLCIQLHMCSGDGNVASEFLPPFPGGDSSSSSSSSSSSASSSSDMCTYCEEVVNYAKILLGNPDAAKEIEGLLTGMCDQLGPLKEPCREFIRENIAQIVHTLAHLDTKTVCVEMHMCSDGGSGLGSSSSSRGGVGALGGVLAPVRSLACDQCRRSSVRLLERLQSAPDALPELSVEACHRLGREDLLCRHHVGVFLAAAKVVGSQEYFCSFFCKDDGGKDEAAACPTRTRLSTATGTPVTTATTTTTTPNPQPPACSQCIEALKTVKEDLGAKLECLEGKLTKYCDAFPPLAQECKAAIEGFFKPLHAQIDGLDPRTICVQIGVCSPTEVVAPSAPNLCLTCQQTVNYAKVLVGEPGVEAQLEQLLINMCGKLGPLKDGCVNYVETNLQQIFDRLKHVDARAICHDLGFCPTTNATATEKEEEEKSFFQTPNRMIPVGILGGVDRPVFSFGGVKDDDNNNNNNDKYQNEKTPLTDGSESERIRTNRVDAVEAETSENAGKRKDEPTDDGVIRLSSMSSAKLEGVVAAARPADNVAVLRGEAEKPASAAPESLELPQMSCFTCKFIMGEGKRILEEDSTVDQLTTLVETVCNDLNGDLKAQCADFLSLYAKTYIKMAVNQLDPTQLCVVMGACEGTPGPTPSYFPGNPLLCFGCQRGLGKLVDYWRLHRELRTKVLTAMQSACLRLPDQKSVQDCVDEVDVMFPVMAQLLSDLDPKKVCHNTGYCVDAQWKHGFF